MMGLIEENLRLPMVPLAERTRVAVREAMVHAGLIN
jgi:4-hydroxy-tetrahydrodipicolinate synthase